MNTNSPLVSICGICYNHSKFLTEAIESFWNQEYKNIEIIVIDDGSPDGSGDMLLKLKEKSPFPMTVLTQENTGNIAYNMNKVMSGAHGKYMVLFSLDDVLLPDAISKSIGIMEQDDNIQFVASSYTQEIDDKSNYRSENIREKNRLRDIDNPSIDYLINMDFQYFHSYFVQGTLLRKSLIDAVGGYDEDIQGDDIIIRSKIAFYIKQHPQMTFKIINEPTFLYRVLGNSIACNSIRQYETIRDFVNRFHPNEETPQRYKNFCYRLIKDGKFSYFFSELKTNPRIKNYIIYLPYWVVKAMVIKLYQVHIRK